MPYPISPQNPTFDQLRGLEARFLSASPDDEIIFYYSGHGYLDDRHYLQLSSDDQGLYPTEDIFRAAARSPKARSILLVFDVCHAGEVSLDIGRIFAGVENRLERAK